MPARPPADPAAFSEAVDFFRCRLPMTDVQFKALEDASHARAFTIAHVGQLQVVTDVWEAIDEALAKGTSFDAFKKTVSDRLTEVWGKPNPGHVETIFRNGVQTSYNRGRWYQMQDPDVVRTRPYLKLSVILDLRTSQVCQPLANTILPADDPWWKAHVPPLHHECRSTLTSLSREQAQQQGISSPPAGDAAEGFGAAPGEGEWQPEYSKYPPRLAQEARRKAKGGGYLPAVTPAPAPIAPPAKPTWTPAPSIKSATRQIEQLGPIALEGDAYKAAASFGRKAFVLSRTSVEGRALTKVDRLSYLNRVGETVTDLANRFPVMEKGLQGGDVRFLAGPSKSQGMASYRMNVSTGERITPYHVSFGPLTEDGYAKRMADYEAQRGMRWTVGGNSVEANVRHELGHLVDYKTKPDLPRLMKEIRQVAGAQGSRAWIQKNVSEYAATKDAETFAELVSVVASPAYVRGTLPAGIERFILDALGSP
jgi:SPP1 gp7 family putative phage head morphogenesis protein